MGKRNAGRVLAIMALVLVVIGSSVATSKPAIDGHPKPAIKRRRGGRSFLLLCLRLWQARFRLCSSHASRLERKILARMVYRRRSEVGMTHGMGDFATRCFLVRL